ncbi:MAG: MurR/RpiR family transcriptional regulator [Anaerorhabdus sp.]
MHLEELINANYAKLNENDHYIWKYISTHRKVCEKLAIEDLAQRCHVSRSTILRFSQRLGLKGYAEFKVYLRLDNEHHVEKETGLELVYQNYLEYMGEIKEKDFTSIIKLISNAKNAYVYGTGSIQNNVAAEIKRSFLNVDKLFFHITSANESHVFADMIDHEDVIIMISYAGENPQLLDFARKLKAKSVPIIAITITKDNTLAHIAEESLIVEVPKLMNPLGPRYEGLVNYFMLVDFIIVKYMDYHERKLRDEA